ncbi:hypothetical protein HPB51_016308 [Rhipicephalus microplus]|uniref:Tick transposon n=1 Tax=Rhipicephalus microplus TaxID=6941 RepID=A0A9J6EPG0_RHIMP|nr:hypothetical protein HPB51_016308 [Rhipicephalus microplus]
MANCRFKHVCFILQIAVIAGCPDVLMHGPSSDTLRRLLPRFSGDRTDGHVQSSTGRESAAADRVQDFPPVDVISINHLYCSRHGTVAALAARMPKDIRAAMWNHHFSGSGGGMANCRFKHVCFILQVTYNYKCCRSDNRCLLLLPDPLNLTAVVTHLVHCLRVSLLLLCGDIETNPGPKVDEMLSQLLAGQARISQELASLSETVASFENRLMNVEAMAASVSNIIPRVSELEQTVGTLQKLVGKLDRQNDELENRLRKNNLIIHGLHETPSETTNHLLESVLDLLSVKLGVNCDDIERCHRLGAVRRDKPRPVIIKLMDFRSKIAIMSNARKLKGTKVYINEDYSARVRLARKMLWQNSQNMRKNARKVKLKHDTLTIDGVRYTWDTDKKAIIKVSTHSLSAGSDSAKSASAQALGINSASSASVFAKAD